MARPVCVFRAGQVCSMAPAVNAITGYHIILNARSGNRDVDGKCAVIRDVLGSAGSRYRLHIVKDARKLRETAIRVVNEARQDGGAVVIAGGDGSINTVAQAVLGSGCVFGVLPQGTFNYFGRTHGIPEDLAEAARALLRAEVRPVQVGLLNNRIFLVNASLGLYPKLLEDREFYKRQLGRSRLVALWSALVTLWRSHRILRVRMDGEDGGRDLVTQTVFVGNNALQLEQVGIPLASQLDNGRLAVVTLKPVGPMAMLGLMLRGAFGKLDAADSVVSFAARELTVKPKFVLSAWTKVATDGEIFWLRAPLRFKVASEPLLLLKPPA
ncbi:diacylglycerol kinase family protein [Noviherbaspirillum sp. CPCC 100848]|uniref:Diacylglycerol kinase family protein n=2 Tax=Noviherbaspirillum album TaxID=3080276 RepID=A0ABU6J2D7_9BURK|nr:diacylglycerol kinase family protein [Noviherbaspirillum sp. CPCC 100848]MEC4717785.1 diacylglycerol kinase family protein [Noviherbaspirillum sp. CPCC 100848]